MKTAGDEMPTMYWILGRKSELSIENKLLVYRTILKPIWTYGITLWGTASNSNIERSQRYQNKALRAAVNARWYMTNKVIHTDLKVPRSREETTNSASSKVKGKGVPRQAEVAQGVPGRLRPRIFLTFGTTSVVGRQPYAPGAFTPGEIPATYF
jgi:hypothetical protein